MTKEEMVKRLKEGCVAEEYFPGVIGNPGTVLLIGNQDLNFGPLSGGRFTLGCWLDPTARLGLEGGYLFLQLGRIQWQHRSSSRSDS